MVNETSRSTAIFCSPLMYSLVTSRAISMNEFSIWPGLHKRPVILAAVLACIAACGSDGNVDSARNSRETKDNMSVPKGVQSAAAADSTRGAGSTRGSVRTPVVLFFGTSLTAGYGLDPEQAFPSLIEK